MPRVIPCGTRRNAYEDFRGALQIAEPDHFIILLVDSEGPVAAQNPWDYLSFREGDQWEKPANSTADNAHLMVQCMEAWFLADQETLENFYGQGFHANSLPRNPALENIPKQDILDGLKNATRNTRKEIYSKGRHSFAILGLIDPMRVADKSPNAKRLFIFLDRLTS